MGYIERTIEKQIKTALKRGKSTLILGARQTGKTTLIKHLKPDLYHTLADHRLRQAYETNPGQFIGEIEFAIEAGNLPQNPIIAIDEVQKVPDMMDGIQYLIDERKARFIISGSSARKIRNFLPGRVANFQLDPLTIAELGDMPDITPYLVFGGLPEIWQTKTDAKKEKLLSDYSENFLEEEIRKEALVRGLGSFRKFLELAAIESGNILNLSKIAQDVGVAHTTISAYYSILEDCKLIERIEPFLYSSTRKRLSKSPKILMFDLGVKRVAAKEPPSYSDTMLGRYFEQLVGLELRRNARTVGKAMTLKYWRDAAGPEVDWILEYGEERVAIEVKWTPSPKDADCKNLKILMSDQPQIKRGIVVCRTEKSYQLTPSITALSWRDLGKRGVI